MLLAQGLAALGWGEDDLASMDRGTVEKEVLAWWLSKRTSVSRAWVSRRTSGQGKEVGLAKRVLPKVSVGKEEFHESLTFSRSRLPHHVVAKADRGLANAESVSLNIRARIPSLFAALRCAFGKGGEAREW